MRQFFNEQEHDTHDVLVRLSSWIRKKCDLPPVAEGYVFSQLELCTLFSFSYVAQKGAGMSALKRLEWWIKDVAEYNRTGELPYYVMRADMYVTENAPHLNMLPAMFCEVWAAALQQETEPVPALTADTIPQERFGRIINSEKLQKATPSPAR